MALDFGEGILLKGLSFSGGAVVFSAVFCMLISGNGQTQTMRPTPLVRIAELEIDPNQIGAYKKALSEEIATSVHAEPGVLMLNAVAVKGQPGQVRIFETYRDQAAYESHLQSPHFKKYKRCDSRDGEGTEAHRD